MRTRYEIEKEIEETDEMFSDEVLNNTRLDIQTELLLDIRELLQGLPHLTLTKEEPRDLDDFVDMFVKPGEKTSTKT